MNTKPMNTQKSVDQLNSLLRGELSAVETYQQAVERFRDHPLPDLEENLRCHRDRIPVLTKRIQQLGGVPATTSGAWGVIANLAEGGAKLFGENSAISMLESGEDRGLADYRKIRDETDPESASIITRDLLPAQERTHRRMSLLKHQQR